MPLDTSQLPAIFEEIKKEFPSSVSEHGWYTMTLSSLITVSNPANITHLYNFLISQPEWSTHEQRRVLSRRLREQLMKQWVVIGIPRVITAVLSLAAAEAPRGRRPLIHQGVTVSPEINARGRELCYALYGEEQYNRIMAACGSMSADFTWASDNIIYGMFLSDESVINRPETSIMSYSCMACMGLEGTSRRHLAGLRNHGANDDELNAVTTCVKKIATWAGIDSSAWITAKDLK
ncbi:hypothetical protein N7468_009445 [Penicillium chermesinum]|uniref:Uncharacterized protein n=1 Tax=Penicillium chermesinum TaxID=63820 RepID=A0A9W9NI46_9EURO|nr:uncharacterized protein N7468_009445 [Penicillium chermesinum]KAJ5220241.1 hypothetical protein N7468_009445 [Penicillium chermesinum]